MPDGYHVVPVQHIRAVRCDFRRLGFGEKMRRGEMRENFNLSRPKVYRTVRECRADITWDLPARH